MKPTLPLVIIAVVALPLVTGCVATSEQTGVHYASTSSQSPAIESAARSAKTNSNC